MELLKIDTRERPKDLINIIKRVLGDDKVSIETLHAADYAVSTWVGIERKRTNNLVSSIVRDYTGGVKEIWGQLKKCMDMYGRVYLLVEGTLEATADPKWCKVEGRMRQVPYVAVQASVDRAQDLGIHVMWTGDMQETALMLKWLYYQTTRSPHAIVMGGRTDGI